MPLPTFEDMNASQVLNRVQSPHMPFRWSLNPYRGCTHGCSFCYARETHVFLGLQADDAFQNHIFVKRNAADALDRQLDRMAARFHSDLRAMADSLGAVAIGTATDPYQAIEAKRGVTRACLEVLQRYQVPITITTRSPLVLRDVDLLTKMDVRAVQISLHTLNRDIWRQFEPATPSPLRRLDALRALSDAGVPAGVFVAPILPYLTDSATEIDAVIASAKMNRAAFAIPSLLRLTPDVKAWFFNVVDDKHSIQSARLRSLYEHSSYPSRKYAAVVLTTVARILATHHLPAVVPNTAAKGSATGWVAAPRAAARAALAEIESRQLLLPV